MTVNLTAQVQAWVNGEPNYGILLGATAEGVHGEYVSREGAAGQQPRLDVVVGSAPASTAAIQVDGTLANGVSRSLVRGAVSARQPASYFFAQPDATQGKDATLKEDGATQNAGIHSEFWIESFGSSQADTGLLEFDLGGLPPDAKVVSATLDLYATYDYSTVGGTAVGVHRLTRDWVEGTNNYAVGSGATWNEAEPGIAWSSGGGDYDTAAIDVASTSTYTLGWYQWDISALVSGWVAGTYPNQGLALVPENGSTIVAFASSDNSTVSRHPKLTVTYACACNVTCLVPQGSGAILMVVGNDVTMAAADAAKKVLFESWGYSVSVIDDTALQAVFDSALASHDVAYISETANGGALGTKLAGAAIGVVSEQGSQNGSLGLASLYANAVATSINVTDNSHYITAPFPAGALDIYSAPMDSLTVSGTPAAGLQQLADIGGAGGLVVLAQGDLLYPTGNAAGRRVMLPLGRNVSFNWNYLNNNGRLLVQRAIEWGRAAPAASTAPGLWVSTTTDVTSSGVPGLAAWSNGQALEVADPNFVLEPGTTTGTFSAILNLDNFAADSDAAIDAMHYVNAAITVGSVNSVDLVAGDVLLSTELNETLTSTNSLAVNDEDVFVFRPDSTGDYSAGRFAFLIDGSQLHGEDDTVGISLIEKDTAVGNGFLSKGSFLMAITNRRDVIEFAAADVGAGTTSGGFNEFIDGPSLNLSSEIRGIDLVEDEITIGTQVVPTGSILLTLNEDDSDGVGDNLVPIDGADIFYLTVTTVGASPVADATKLFEGLDVNLNTGGEHLQSVSLTNTVPGITLLKVLFVVNDALALTAQETAHVTLMADTWGFAVTSITQSATQTEFDAAAALNNVAYVSHDVTLQTVGDKLKNFTIGVVNEEYLLSDELGFSGGYGSAMTTTLNITDDSHDITSGFSNGALTIFNANAAATGAAVVLAPTRQVLGKVSTISALMTLETGSSLYGGGTAAGRRVQVPWGYIFSALNADGQTLMRQAIEWAAETGTPGSPLLFVVSDDNAPTAEEILRKHLVESWGYMVTVVEDSDSQANFDAFAATNDVAYISSGVLTSALGSKLTAATIGVVNEHDVIAANLGLVADEFEATTGSSLVIENNTHYITETFSLGSLTILTTSDQLYAKDDDLAPGIVGLGRRAGAPTFIELAVLNSGGALWGGGTAPGRRVQLPWGDSAFDVNTLTTAGETIMRRAIEWAGDPGGGGGGGGGGGVVFEEFTEAKRGSNGHTLNINKPAGTTSGDLLIAAIATDGSTKSSLALSGWNIINIEDQAANVTLGVWWKLAGGSDVGNYTFTWSGNQKAYGMVLRFTGHDATNPINVSANTQGSTSSPTSPAVTTTVPNTMILRLGGFDDDDISLDSTGLTGHTEITMDESSSGSGTTSAGAGFVQQAAAGGSGTANFSLTASEQYRAVTIGIAPQ